MSANLSSNSEAKFIKIQTLKKSSAHCYQLEPESIN
jgi:hypothetical protein